MTDVKNSRLYKTLKKAIRRQDHAELLRMLEMIPESAYEGPWEGFDSDDLWKAFAWLRTPQGEWWCEVWDRVEGYYQHERRP